MLYNFIRLCNQLLNRLAVIILIILHKYCCKYCCGNRPTDTFQSHVMLNHFMKTFCYTLAILWFLSLVTKVIRSSVIMWLLRAGNSRTHTWLGLNTHWKVSSYIMTLMYIIIIWKCIVMKVHSVWKVSVRFLYKAGLRNVMIHCSSVHCGVSCICVLCKECCALILFRVVLHHLPLWFDWIVKIVCPCLSVCTLPTVCGCGMSIVEIDTVLPLHDCFGSPEKLCSILVSKFHFHTRFHFNNHFIGI